MTDEERLEVQRILKELKGLLDQVLRISLGAAGECGPVLSFAASASNVTDPAIVDKLVMAVDAAALDVLNTLNHSGNARSTHPFVLARAESPDQPLTSARQSGELMSVADEALLALVGESGTPSPKGRVRFLSLGPESS